MSDPKLRALVVGTGFGCRIQIPALRGAGFEVVGLVGTDAERTTKRAAQNGVARGFTGLVEAIDETGPDVVVIATPPLTHGQLVIAALERGCHVLCEKPFARDADEARAMLEAARAAGRVHMLGNEFRYASENALIARAIEQGMIGEPRFACLTQYSGYVRNFEDEIPSWWFDPGQGGGWLGASGSHIVDRIRTWLGDFASLSAKLCAIAANRGPADDFFTVRFTLASGVEGVIHQSSGDFGPFADLTRISGTEGTLWLSGGHVHHADRSGERELPVPADLVLPAPAPVGGDDRHDGVEWKILTPLELPPYTQLCIALREAISGDPQSSLVKPATFEDGLCNMAVLDAIRASARHDGAVQTL